MAATGAGAAAQVACQQHRPRAGKAAHVSVTTTYFHGISSRWRKSCHVCLQAVLDSMVKVF